MLKSGDHNSTPQQFWLAFTDVDGKHMDWTAILTAVRRQRVEDDRQLAQDTRREYGASFSEHFSYKKSGKTHTYQKDMEIAKRYRQLRGSGEQSD